MASPKNPDVLGMGLNASEARILLFSIVCITEPGKVSNLKPTLRDCQISSWSLVTRTNTSQIDYNKIAEKTNYTVGSSRTVYNNARRKLQKLHGDDANAGATNTGADDQAGDGSSTAKTTAKKPRKSTGGRKKKQGKEEPKGEAIEEVNEEPAAEEAGDMEAVTQETAPGQATLEEC